MKKFVFRQLKGEKNHFDQKCQIFLILELYQLNGHIYWHFFLIFDHNDVFFILVEFASDRISSRVSAKNGRNGADGFICKIFVKSELLSQIYDKNYIYKKKFMSLRQFWNFRGATCRVPRHESNLYNLFWGYLERKSDFFVLRKKSFWKDDYWQEDFLRQWSFKIYVIIK